ncbi:MAG: hypothetical protein QME63_05595 [Actinomycetota bacterium]|nr:hypothetical protein [Actinomycetota bacterium]
MMWTINSLSKSLEKKFGDQVRVTSYNTYYDDTYEIKPLIEQIMHKNIRLPAVFIDNKLVVEGHIDELIISNVLANKGLDNVTKM